MTALLGWTWADGTEAVTSLDGIRAEYQGRIAALFATVPLPDARDHLRCQQNCFRVSDAFLPHPRGMPIPPVEAVLADLQRLGGFGQLRVTLRMEQASQRDAVGSGRAYLQALRERRAKADCWRNAARSVLRALAADMESSAQTLDVREADAVCDLLLPAAPDAVVAARFRQVCARSAALAALPAKIAVSGLWPPLSFVHQGAPLDA